MMSYTIQYNRDHNPLKTRIFTDDWHRAVAHFDRVSNDSACTNVELIEDTVLMSANMEESHNV